MLDTNPKEGLLKLVPLMAWGRTAISKQGEGHWLSGQLLKGSCALLCVFVLSLPLCWGFAVLEAGQCVELGATLMLGYEPCSSASDKVNLGGDQPQGASNPPGTSLP